MQPERHAAEPGNANCEQDTHENSSLHLMFAVNSYSVNIHLHIAWYIHPRPVSKLRGTGQSGRLHRVSPAVRIARTQRDPRESPMATVLIVEDDPNDLYAAAEMAEKLGFSTVEA